MNTIETKYCKATDTRCSGVRAKTYGKSMFVAWDYSLTGGENHKLAACKLASSMGLHGKMYQLDPVSKTGWIFAFINDSTPFGTLGRKA